MKLYDCKMAPNPRRVRIFLASGEADFATDTIVNMNGASYLRS